MKVPSPVKAWISVFSGRVSFVNCGELPVSATQIFQIHHSRAKKLARIASGLIVNKDSLIKFPEPEKLAREALVVKLFSTKKELPVRWQAFT